MDIWYPGRPQPLCFLTLWQQFWYILVTYVSFVPPSGASRLGEHLRNSNCPHHQAHGSSSKNTHGKLSEMQYLMGYSKWWNKSNMKFSWLLSAYSVLALHNVAKEGTWAHRGPAKDNRFMMTPTWGTMSTHACRAWTLLPRERYQQWTGRWRSEGKE